MKRIFIAAITAVTLFAGCAKENTDYTPVSQDVKINFDIAGKVGFGADTKAVKSDWAVGDEILVVFQGISSDWLDCVDCNNSLKLTKTVDGWNVDDSKFPEISSLKSGKRFFALHYPGNINVGSMSGIIAYPSTYQPGYEYLYFGNTYTVEGNEVTLGTLSLKRKQASFQIAVRDFADQEGDWIMKLHLPTKHNLDECLTSMYMYFSGAGQISGTGAYDASGVTIGTDKVYNFRGRSSDKVVKWISLTGNYKTYYYKLETETTIADLGDKAWYLPELKINGSYEVESGCAWTTEMVE